MAVTGLDFLLPTIQQRNYDPASTIMDKQSFDLNKHAFDLNEVPLSELGLDLQEASCSHELGSSLHPKKGGWLELFRNMFGNDKTTLDSFPFASCTTMLNSSCINHASQADRTRQQSDPRIHSTQALQTGQKFHIGNGFSEKGDAAKHSGAGTAYIPHIPLYDHAGMGASHIGKPLINASGQPGCANGIFPSLYTNSEGFNFRAGVAPWACHSIGPQQMGSLYSSPEEACVGVSVSHGIGHYKVSVPVWDLKSQPFPKRTTDFQPLGLATSPCPTSSGHLSHTQGLDKIGNQRVSEATESPQVDIFPEPSKNCKALTTFLAKEKGPSCLMKKASSRFDKGKAVESSNAENCASLSEDKGKGQDLRVRIIPSPDWLPAGWITELKTRMAGSTAGTTDKYYKDPMSGRRFRSKNEVLNYLQTGRLCRSKPQLKSFESFAALSTMPLLLPRQDQSAGFLENAQAVLPRPIYSTPLKDLSSHVSMHQSLCPPNRILERIEVKQEHVDMPHVDFFSAGSNVCHVSDTMQERVELEANESGRCNMPVGPGISDACMNTESVYTHKRKVTEDSFSMLSPKRFCNTIKELQGKDKWIFGMNPMSREAEMQEISAGAESDTKIGHTSYPGLLYRQDSKAIHDIAVNDYLTARYRANAKALGLYDTLVMRRASVVNLGSMKDLHPRAVSTAKVVEKKSVKLTLKQERELLVSLGRELCAEFLASARESSLQ